MIPVLTAATGSLAGDVTGKRAIGAGVIETKRRGWLALSTAFTRNRIALTQ
jgi:hypothetical protein